MEKNSLTTFTYHHVNVNRVIIFCLIGFFCFLLFVFAFIYSIIWLSAPIVIFVLYLWIYGITFIKLKAADKNKLTFSTDGIQYGSEIYAAKDIEAVAIYIYAFDGFEYREGFVNAGQMGNVYVRAPGDKNTISFRSQGKVMDFSFYLDSYAQFCLLRKVINDWISEGISVAEKQEFDDDFIMQEMNYYGTPTGL
jgi:hypothetical protein